MSTRKKIALLVGPLTALLVSLFLDIQPGKPEVTQMAGIVLWMAIWWLSEAVHLSVTAMLPLILLPLLGIMNGKDVATQYMDQTIFLFIGGFILAFAIERWHLHKRIAFKILMTVGAKPSNILLGVMLSSFFISMWISNTATVLMLLAAVMAIVTQLNQHITDEKEKTKTASALLIALSYSATIGGLSTLVGTPTNMIFYREYLRAFPLNNDMNFLNWFASVFPLAIILLLACYFVIKKIFIGRNKSIKVDSNYFAEQYKQLGPPSYEEKVVGFLFILVAILWFTRTDLSLGSLHLKGWANLFPNKDYLNDSTVAISMAVLLFLIPAKNEKNRAIITWEEASKLPFDIVLLFGGGFALAKGFEVSGLSNWASLQLSFVSNYPLIIFILIMCVAITVISEFASNVACIQLMIPILIALQKDMMVHPLILMIPATLAASLGFMLPVATAPNTIVYGTGKIKLNYLLITGLIMDVIGVVLITIWAYIK